VVCRKIGGEIQAGRNLGMPLAGHDDEFLFEKRCRSESARYAVEAPYGDVDLAAMQRLEGGLADEEAY